MAKDFNEKEKMQRLLWCDRHCCLCDKSCGIDIELAHIDPEWGNNIDNAIPVCYDCHARIGRYISEHPRGNKFRIEELKKRREQIYDKYTRHLIVPVPYKILKLEDPHNPGKKEGKYPDIAFSISNVSDYLPIRLYISLSGMLNNKDIDLKLGKGLYTSDKIWNLNPQNTVDGHFQIQNKRLQILKDTDSLEVKVKIRLIDVLDREHTLLENGYVYNHKEGYWSFEP